MSLRDDLIEAGARALERTPAPNPIEYNRTRIVLDAFLDTLADRADDWSVDGVIDADSVMLLAVLRGDTE